jgi:hypothetical protein
MDKMDKITLPADVRTMTVSDKITEALFETLQSGRWYSFREAMAVDAFADCSGLLSKKGDNNRGWAFWLTVRAIMAEDVSEGRPLQIIRQGNKFQVV